jgi:hypothetical protein
MEVSRTVISIGHQIVKEPAFDRDVKRKGQKSCDCKLTGEQTHHNRDCQFDTDCILFFAIDF